MIVLLIFAMLFSDPVVEITNISSVIYEEPHSEFNENI